MPTAVHNSLHSRPAAIRGLLTGWCVHRLCNSRPNARLRCKGHPYRIGFHPQPYQLLEPTRDKPIPLADLWAKTSFTIRSMACLEASFSRSPLILRGTTTPGMRLEPRAGSNRRGKKRSWALARPMHCPPSALIQQRHLARSLMSPASKESSAKELASACNWTLELRGAFHGHAKVPVHLQDNIRPQLHLYGRSAGTIFYGRRVLGFGWLSPLKNNGKKKHTWIRERTVSRRS